MDRVLADHFQIRSDLFTNPNKFPFQVLFCRLLTIIIALYSDSAFYMKDRIDNGANFFHKVFIWVKQERNNLVWLYT